MATDQNTHQPQPHVEPMTPPDWSIDDLYRKAWQIVKKNKILWVFAAALGIGGYNFSNSFDSNSKSFEGLQKYFQNNSTQHTDGLSRVLGVKTSAMGDLFTSIFSAIPWWYYLLFILDIFALIIIAIIITLVYKTWATGALYENIQRCIEGGKADIREASEKAFGYIKPLIFIDIVPGLVFFLAVIVTFTCLAVAMIIIPDAYKLIIGLLVFVAIIIAVIAFILLALTLIWAPRQVVIDKKSAMAAIKDSYKIVKKKKWSMLLLGLVNTLLSVIIVIVPIAIFAMVIGGGLVTAILAKSSSLIVVLILIAIPLILAFIILYIVGSAVLTAFKAAVWSLAYNNIRGKYDKV